jgi:signal transduction histidine kinase
MFTVWVVDRARGNRMQIANMAVVVGHLVVAGGLVATAWRQRRSLRWAFVACAAFVVGSGVALASLWPSPGAWAWLLGSLGVVFGVWVLARVEQVDCREAVEEAKAELARSNAQLQRFAHVASHELLARRYENELDEPGREFIAHIVDGSERMRVLIRDLLEYSRLDRPRERNDMVDLDEVFEETTKQLSAAIARTGAAIERGDLPTIRGDRSELVRMLSNLLDNAIKYHRNAPPEVEVGAQATGGRVLLFVRDNGIGIDPKHVQRIFEIFRRLHSKSTYPGTGLGLAICRKIVEAHGGKIWVESSPGEGSTFWCSFPEAA